MRSMTTRVRNVRVSPASILRDAGSVREGIRQVLKTQPWWQTTLIVIGFISLVTAISVLFLGANNTPTHITTTEPMPALDSEAFTLTLSRLLNAPVDHGGTVTVLNNGDEFVPALLTAINGARSSVNFSVYIWEDGEMSNRVLDALIARQQQGVQVRVLLDGLGGRKAPDDRFEALAKLGGRVEKFRTPRFGTWTRFHRRNHRRSIVVDGAVGFTGGMAVGDKWLGHAQDPEHWRDTMFKVTGPLASSLQAAFADEWAGSSGEILVGDAFYPKASAAAAGGVERFIHLVNSPADDDHSMSQFFVLSVLAARERIYIGTPYFIPDDPLEDALIAKAQAGLDVRLLFPGSRTDHRFVRLSGQNHYEALLAAGVKIYEYQPTFTHAKFAVFDGRWSAVGSPNMNSRSRGLDEENVYGMLDRALAARLEQVFRADASHAKEITLDEWRRRNPLVRALQMLSTILDEQS
jgi:cardiolipin synthase